MNKPVQITFRHMEKSDALEQLILEKAEWLDAFFPRIVGCRVVVEAPTGRHRQGGHFRVMVDVSVPGHDLVAGRSPDARAEHEDAYIAVREAFKHARRELQDMVRRRREPVAMPPVIP